MAYAILTPQNTIYKIINENLPVGKTHEELGVLPVDISIPTGFVRIGWKIENGIVVSDMRPITSEELNPPRLVPSEVGPLQFRKALRKLNLKSTIDAMISTQPEEIREEYEYCTIVKRDNPLLETLAYGLGMSKEDIDSLFILAETFV